MKILEKIENFHIYIFIYISLCKYISHILTMFLKHVAGIKQMHIVTDITPIFLYKEVEVPICTTLVYVTHELGLMAILGIN